MQVVCPLVGHLWIYIISFVWILDFLERHILPLKFIAQLSPQTSGVVDHMSLLWIPRMVLWNINKEVLVHELGAIFFLYIFCCNDVHGG